MHVMSKTVKCSEIINTEGCKEATPYRQLRYEEQGMVNVSLKSMNQVPKRDVQ